MYPAEVELILAPHPDIADMVVDGCKAWFLGQAEERPFHRVALVADGYVREVGGKQVGLDIPLGG